MTAATAEKPKGEEKPAATRAPKPGATTKRPADLKKAQQQPPKGHAVTDAMVRRARSEWGIEPYVNGSDWVATKPATRGHIVHAKLKDGKPERTLCGTLIAWAGGEAEAPRDEMNCLWCQARIKTFGKPAAKK